MPGLITTRSNKLPPALCGKQQQPSVDELRSLIAQRLSTTVEDGSCEFLFENHIAELVNLLFCLCEGGESNSVLLTGPRSVGKTQCVQSALSRFKCIESMKGFARHLAIIKLNGFLLTDDRKALREIGRQMNSNVPLGTDSDDSDSEDETTAAAGSQLKPSFLQNFNQLLDGFSTDASSSSSRATKRSAGSGASRRIVFWLQEFDLFAEHAGQSQHLLYCLLNAAQKSDPPILVIGETSRLDVLEMLEKRVKSRFSHRQIFIFPKWSFPDYCKAFTKLLDAPESLGAAAKQWNKRVTEILSDENVEKQLQEMHGRSPSLADLKVLLRLCLAQTTVERPMISVASVQSSTAQISFSARAALLNELSLLQLMILVAMKNVLELTDDEFTVFDTVWGEYQKFVTKHKPTMAYPKLTILKAFESLLPLELIRPFSGQISTSMHISQQRMRLHVSAWELIETVDAVPKATMPLRNWTSGKFFK